MIRIFNNFILTLLLLFFSINIIGCEQEGPMEKAGKAIDEAAEDVEKAADRAMDDAEKAVEDTKKNVEKAIE